MAAPTVWTRAKSGFEVTDDLTGRLDSALRWDEITRIRTYKVDLLTTDCICLLFERPGAAPLIRRFDGSPAGTISRHPCGLV